MTHNCHTDNDFLLDGGGVTSRLHTDNDIGRFLCILGLRGVITLKNSLNYPAEFTWAPNLGEKGTAFSIRPATGKLFTLTCILQSSVPFFLCNQKDFDQYLIVISNFM